MRPDVYDAATGIDDFEQRRIGGPRESYLQQTLKRFGYALRAELIDGAVPAEPARACDCRRFAARRRCSKRCHGSPPVIRSESK